METAQDPLWNDFIKKCTPWREADSFLFTDDDGARGMFRMEPVYSRRSWSIDILTESQDWSTPIMPTSLPTHSPGTYTYLVELTAFDFHKDPKSLIHDFLWPWDSGTVRTSWIKQDNLRVGYSRHAKHRHIRRYLTYFVNDQDEQIPVSKVLYQYIVEPIREAEGSVKEEASTSMVNDAVDDADDSMVTDDIEEFLSRCTRWGEEDEDCHKFTVFGNTGLYSKKPEFPGKAWGLKILSEPQDWSTPKMPETFPHNSTGSYRYLVQKKAFAKDPISIVNDFLHPWDTSGKSLKWSNTMYEKGNLRHCHLRHSQYTNIRRYITFFSDDANLPISPVLYQYVVEPPVDTEEAQKPSSSKAKSTAQKRRSEHKPVYENEMLIRLEIPRQTAKRRKSEANFQPCTLKATPSRRGADRKPISAPTPPASDAGTATPQPAQEQPRLHPMLAELHGIHQNLQQAISETKERYCALTNPKEMTAMNQKLIKLYGLDNELQQRMADLSENTKNAIRDIVMDMEAPLPTFQVPVAHAVLGDSDMDTPQRRINVKTEVIDL